MDVSDRSDRNLWLRSNLWRKECRVKRTPVVLEFYGLHKIRTPMTYLSCFLFFFFFFYSFFFSFLETRSQSVTRQLRQQLHENRVTVAGLSRTYEAGVVDIECHEHRNTLFDGSTLDPVIFCGKLSFTMENDRL